MLREDYMFIVGILIGMIAAALIMVSVYNLADTKYLLLKWASCAIVVVVVPSLIWVNLKFRGIF